MLIYWCNVVFISKIIFFGIGLIWMIIYWFNGGVILVCYLGVCVWKIIDGNLFM